MSDIVIKLVDVNKSMVSAWRETFEDNPEVEIIHGSMLEQDVDAWVSPTNSHGNMDGGLDAIVKGALGAQVQSSLKAEIKRQFNGHFPLGTATCIETTKSNPKFLISTPTMHSSSENVSDSLNTALACAAAFQIVKMKNKQNPGSITSIAIPGLGANTGRVPVANCADLMWTAYDIFCNHEVEDFQQLRAVLESQLGDLTPMKSSPKAKNTKPKTVSKAKASNSKKPAVKSLAKEEEVDFDDFD